MITKRAKQLPRRNVTHVTIASRCIRATCPATVGGGKPRSTTTVEPSRSPLDLDHHAHHVLSSPGGRVLHLAHGPHPALHHSVRCT